MFKIVKKRELNPTVTEMVIEAPLIAKKAKAGQFIIIRAKEDSERIPLTTAHYDAAAGTVAIIFQIVGAGTMQLNSLKEGEYVHDFVGPLGKATEIEGLKNVCVVGGGVGCAIALPVAPALKAQGTKVTGIIGFRNKDLVILEDEFRACCDELIIMSDDGSYGQKGVVTMPLEEKLKAFNFNVLTITGHAYDQIESAIKAFHAENDKPTCIILDTVKGTGVSFMTNSVDWHGKGPNDEEYAVAMQELNAAYAALEQEEK